MPWEPIDKYMLCIGYWVHGIRERDNIIVQIAAINEDGILTTDGYAFLFEDVTRIEITREWLEAAGFLELTETLVEAQQGAYGIAGFPFTFLLHNYVAILYRDETFGGIRFVHELQHFYAGIKLRQLEINPPADPHPW